MDILFRINNFLFSVPFHRVWSLDFIRFTPTVPCTCRNPWNWAWLDMVSLNFESEPKFISYYTLFFNHKITFYPNKINNKLYKSKKNICLCHTLIKFSLHSGLLIIETSDQISGKHDKPIRSDKTRVFAAAASLVLHTTAAFTAEGQH